MTPPKVRSERLELTPLAAPAVDALLARDRGTLERLTGGRFEDPSPPPYMADALPGGARPACVRLPRRRSWWNWLVVRRETREAVGSVAFAGPPDRDGAVLIGYAMYPAFEGQGTPPKRCGR